MICCIHVEQFGHSIELQLSVSFSLLSVSTSDPGSVTTGRQPPDQVPEEIPTVSDEALRFIDSIGKESSCLYKGQRFSYIKPGV